MHLHIYCVTWGGNQSTTLFNEYWSYRRIRPTEVAILQIFIRFEHQSNFLYLFFYSRFHGEKACGSKVSTLMSVRPSARRSAPDQGQMEGFSPRRPSLILWALGTNSSRSSADGLMPLQLWLTDQKKPIIPRPSFFSSLPLQWRGARDNTSTVGKRSLELKWLFVERWGKWPQPPWQPYCLMKKRSRHRVTEGKDKHSHCI